MVNLNTLNRHLYWRKCLGSPSPAWFVTENQILLSPSIQTSSHPPFSRDPENVRMNLNLLEILIYQNIYTSFFHLEYSNVDTHTYWKRINLLFISFLRVQLVHIHLNKSKDALVECCSHDLIQLSVIQELLVML